MRNTGIGKLVSSSFFYLSAVQGNSVSEMVNICRAQYDDKPKVEVISRKDGDPAVLVASRNAAERSLSTSIHAYTCRLRDERTELAEDMFASRVLDGYRKLNHPT